MARRRKSSSRKKGSSNFRSKLLFFLLLLILGVGFGIYRYPTTARQWCAVIAEKVRSVRQNPPKKPKPEPIVTVPGSTAAQQQEVITVPTKYDHLRLGVPGKADTIIDRPGYALGYIEYHEQPAWVIYRLTKEQALTKAAKRGDDFKEDPDIPTGSATPADYRSSGFDRGHLAPAADMAYSMRTMGDSFFMSNMSPQRPKFNRGVWKDLEAQVRNFAITEQDVYIVTGPILPKTKTVTIGSNKVTVPTHYYKIVYDRTPPEKMIAFILPNDGSDRPLQDFAVTVDAVEAATGLNFFSVVPQPKQEQLESTISVQDWRWKKRK